MSEKANVPYDEGVSAIWTWSRTSACHSFVVVRGSDPVGSRCVGGVLWSGTWNGREVLCGGVVLMTAMKDGRRLALCRRCEEEIWSGSRNVRSRCRRNRRRRRSSLRRRSFWSEAWIRPAQA